MCDCRGHRSRCATIVERTWKMPLSSACTRSAPANGLLMTIMPRFSLAYYYLIHYADRSCDQTRKTQRCARERNRSALDRAAPICTSFSSNLRLACAHYGRRKRNGGLRHRGRDELWASRRVWIRGDGTAAQIVRTKRSQGERSVLLVTIYRYTAHTRIIVQLGCYVYARWSAARLKRGNVRNWVYFNSRGTRR